MPSALSPAAANLSRAICVTLASETAAQDTVTAYSDIKRVAPDAHAKAYELTDALSSGRKDAAADILAQLYASGAAPAYLLRVLSNLLIYIC